MCHSHCGHPDGRVGKSVAARDINNRLDEIRAAALGIFAEQSAIREDVTAEDVKHQLLGMASEQETLLSYFQTFHYKFRETRLLDQSYGKDIEGLPLFLTIIWYVFYRCNISCHISLLPHWTVPSLKNMTCTYVRNVVRLQAQYVNSTVQLKTIVGEAIADGIITVFPFVGYEPVHPKPEQKYLTSEELNRDYDNTSP